MKQKFIKFNWIVNNLISHNLLINYLKLKQATAHHCSAAVLKNQKQPLADVLQNRPS